MSEHFIFQARFGTTDVIVTFFNCLMIYTFLKADMGNDKWWYGFGVALGLGVMTKWVAAFFAPIAIFIYLVLAKTIDKDT